MHADETVTLSSLGPHDTQEQPAVVPRQIGPVRLIRELGCGGMGIVWLGRHQVLARDVAVKFLFHAAVNSSGPGLQQLLSEARAAAAVRHPGLVAVHNADVVNGMPYLVMDYIDGVSLAQLVKRLGPLPIGVALAVLDTVSDAVAALHDAGLVHRDIKPQNVLLSRAGGVFVSDFGLAFACAPARHTQSRAAAGTPSYMAPEMFAGEVAPRGDVYALGVTMYEVLAGVRPFRGESVDEIRARHANQPLPREPLAARGVPDALVDALERATNKQALFRTKTARQFGEALRTAVPDREIRSRGALDLARLVERCGTAASAPPSAGADPATPTSTFEMLAGKAALKRGSRDAAADAPGPPASGATSAALPASEVLCVETLCVTCGYNLRGLPATGRCSECGTPIGRSVNADRLAAADPAWLQRVYRGQAVGAAGLGALIGTYTLTMIVAMTTNLADLPTWATAAIDIGVPFAMLATLFLMLAGVVMVTALDPRLSLASQPLGLRRIARGAALATLLLLGGAQVLPLTYRLLHRAVEVAVVVMLLFTLAAVCFYLARLAERVPDRQLAKRTRNAAIGLIVSLLGTSICAYLSGAGPTVGLRGSDVPDAGAFETVLRLLRTFLMLAFSIALLSFFVMFARVWSDYRAIFKRCMLESRRLSDARPTAP